MSHGPYTANLILFAGNRGLQCSPTPKPDLVHFKLLWGDCGQDFHCDLLGGRKVPSTLCPSCVPLQLLRLESNRWPSVLLLPTIHFRKKKNSGSEVELGMWLLQDLGLRNHRLHKELGHSEARRIYHPNPRVSGGFETLWVMGPNSPYLVKSECDLLQVTVTFKDKARRSMTA